MTNLPFLIFLEFFLVIFADKILKIEYSIERNKRRLTNMDEAIVMNIVAKQLNIATDTLQKNTSFAALGADSLDVFQIISALEEAYHIEFDNHEAEKIKTIGDAMAYIRKSVGN